MALGSAWSPNTLQITMKSLIFILVIYKLISQTLIPPSLLGWHRGKCSQNNTSCEISAGSLNSQWAIFFIDYKAI